MPQAFIHRSVYISGTVPSASVQQTVRDRIDAALERTQQSPVDYGVELVQSFSIDPSTGNRAMVVDAS
ncbi:MAG: hypothetical protein U5K37_09920 [Natrialbaceae archaeon]|nr:hypothetical protein [Natrialbaceae archaeon]